MITPNMPPDQACHELCMRLKDCPSAAIAETYAEIYRHPFSNIRQAATLVSTQAIPALSKLFKIPETTIAHLIAPLTIGLILDQLKQHLGQSDAGFAELARLVPEVAMLDRNRYNVWSTSGSDLGRLARAIKICNLSLDNLPNIVPDILQARIEGPEANVLRALLGLLGFDISAEAGTSGVQIGHVRIDFLDNTAIITDTAVGEGDENSLRFFGIFP